MSWYTELLNRGASKAKKSKKQVDERPPTEKEPAVKIDLVNSQHLFYDLIFGDTHQKQDTVIEQIVIDRVSNILIQPDKINFEPLPKALAETLEKIDQQCDLDAIQQSLSQDPILASEVLRLANTAAFRRTLNEVSNLKLAISMVGMKSLRQIVTAASISGITQVNSVYFKLFGEKIWQHSLTTAKFCEQKALAQGLDPFIAFFVGIIHDVGKIAIFSELVNAIQDEAPGAEPGSRDFRKVMTSLSKQLTFNIARSWQLPAAIIEPIKQHIVYKVTPEINPITLILVESTLMSELFLLVENEMITLQQAGAILTKKDISLDNLALIEQALIKV